MKKIRFSLLAFMAAVTVFSFTACSDDKPESTPDVPTIDEGKYHFDLFVTVDKHGGMSSKNTTIVNSTASLAADKGVITIKREGAELNDFSMESISKGKYYYQIPSTADRFVKYQIKNNSVQTIKERPFKANSYKARSYTHAWLNDNTLVIMSANGKADKIIWTKLNTDDMSISGEGTLALPLPASILEGEETKKFTTSGILTYNEKAGKLYYFYFGKNGASGASGKATTNFYTAVLNPETMAVESKKMNTKAHEMAGSAYGELMQNCVMYDEDGNLYLAAFNNIGKVEEGCLLRIKKGESDIDPTYNGYKNTEGKLLTVQYLGGNKALAYVRNDSQGTKIDSYSHYYVIVNLSTGQSERLKYNGKEIAYSGGRFSQRSVIFNNKAYIGVNTKDDANSIIYIYDIKTGSVEKGAEVGGSFFFDMIRVIEND
ncbi:hypothetical protein EV202_10914 [Bacteroides heparinolyticus]|uniref:DUF4374 domain-containing protein n=1 Tax=Prevotella heparinolytica TaxID=28113 RepID=A0A4R2M6Y5_9BACE|nr:hypothetical protein [Bacteroides heparinolyticus]TCO92562.1 hypothetical protein EV202_10914 [Bacteroides heparinolyticus]